MSEDKTCPICEEGVLKDHVGRNTVQHLNVQAFLAICFSTCNSCGSKMANADQVRKNAELMREFRERVELMLAGKLSR